MPEDKQEAYAYVHESLVESIVTTQNELEGEPVTEDQKPRDNPSTTFGSPKKVNKLGSFFEQQMKLKEEEMDESSRPDARSIRQKTMAERF